MEEIERIVGRIRARWPRVRILLRGDGGFAREVLMAWCEANRIDYLFGLARNARLVGEIETEMSDARTESEASGKPARRFRDFTWSTLDSWSRARRVVGKAEWTGGEANPRFIVTSLKAAEAAARHLYETIYCARGQADIYQASCVSRVSLCWWYRTGLSARWARRAERSQALDLSGIGHDQPNWPPLAGFAHGVPAACRAAASGRPTGRASRDAPPARGASIR